MDDLTYSVQIVKAHQALLGHDTNEGHWHTFVIIALDHLQKVDAEDLEDHDEVLPVGAMVQEAVQKLNTATIVASDILELLRFILVVLLQGTKPLWLHPITSHLVEDFDFVKGSNQVVAG